MCRAGHQSEKLQSNSYQRATRCIADVIDLYRITEPTFRLFIIKGESEVHRLRGGERLRLALRLGTYQFIHAGGGCGGGPLLGWVGPETSVEHVRDAAHRSACRRRLRLSAVLKDLEINSGSQKKEKRRS